MEYSECCHAYHAGLRTAPTAESLMRSRYAAYVLEEIRYLVDTTHPSFREKDLAANYLSTAKSIQWIGLAVLQVFQGTESDKTGKVEFEASYIQEGQRSVHHEQSRFKRHAGDWYYLDGVVSDQTV
ncbi:YchJ family protein [Coraliomargarita sp. W4R53]